MTGDITYQALTARHTDFHRRAAERRRGIGFGARHGSRSPRITALIRHRRSRGTTRTATAG